MSVWVIESNGKPYRQEVGDLNMGRQKTRTFMYDSEDAADRQLTRLLNQHAKRDGRKRKLNLCYVEYVRKVEDE
jgi:hypothetical protein